jgi:hypothetical protein
MKRDLAPLALLLGLVACGPGTDEYGEPEELSTVEVAEGVTSGMRYDEDATQRADRSGDALTGVLPGDFPRGLRLPDGLSVWDFGAEGERWVTLRSTSDVATLERRLASVWRADGWSQEGPRWRKGSQSVGTRIVPAPGGAELRIDY